MPQRAALATRGCARKSRTAIQRAGGENACENAVPRPDPSPSMITVILVLAMVLAMVMAAFPGWAASAVIRMATPCSLARSPPARRHRCAGTGPDLHRRPCRSLDLRRRCPRRIGQTNWKAPGSMQRPRPRQEPPKRHSGVCTVEGQTASLNQLLLHQGFALNFEPATKGRFREDEAGAKNDARDCGRMFCRPGGIPSRQEGRRPARPVVQGRQGS